MSNGRKRRWRGPAKRRGHLLDVTGQLLELVSARVPFVEGMRLAATDAPSACVRNALLAMHAGLERGEALHETMKRLPNFFPGHYVDIVRCGEETGRLEHCLEQLNAELRNDNVWKDVRTALTYPILAGSLLVLQATALIVFVAPQFARIFEELGAQLPLPTLFLLWIGDTIQGTSGLVVLGIVAVFVLSVTTSPGQSFYRALFGPILSLPFLWKFRAKYYLGRTSSVLAKLLDAGVPLHTALASMAKMDISRDYAKAFERLLERVETGMSLKDALERDRHWFIPSYRGIVALGETSGLLPQAFEQAAESYREELRQATGILTRLIEPALVVAMAFSVNFVVLGIFIPLMGISSVVDH